MPHPAHYFHPYSSPERELFITEFGHSAPQKPRTVGPYVREAWLLHIVTRGVCHFGGFDAQAGEAFLIAKGKLHTFSVEPGYEHYWIAFDGAHVPLLGAMFQLDMNTHQHLQLCDESFPLDEMLETTFDHNPTEQGVRTLLLMLLSQYAPMPSDGHAGDDVQRACGFIRNNLYRRVSMEEVAQQVNLSEKYLCRLFKRELGETPMQYLMRMRMEQAKNLLCSTQMRVRDISLTVGYPSQLAFSSAFSAYWGICPTEMRKSPGGE